MNEEAKNFARNLKLLMDHHGDTQENLERRSGVSQKTISNMLNPGDNRAPNLNKIASVAAAYKLKPWHLLLPDITLDILINSSVEKLLEIYTQIDQGSRETVLRVAENSARYPAEISKKKINNNG
jgi:transcriptional regulator with XRE-family HTH domain